MSIKLRDYLNYVDSCTEIRVDNGEGSIYFYGTKDQIKETNEILDYEISDHCYGKFGHEIMYISVMVK